VVDFVAVKKINELGDPLNRYANLQIDLLNS
jgi:hypothetical protein